ncbi:MAG: PilT/PilU family type 4a pilus ATPase [Salinisphaeraceae bacterium]|nr:PilT/PilU family type 4a pilus ATPase [Salinisphaeraceae bacterium]
MERDKAVQFVQNLLREMKKRGGSDLFITAGFPPAIKVDGALQPVSQEKLSAYQSSVVVRSMMNDRQLRDFEATKECNFAIGTEESGRFRVSAFVQQDKMGAVLRTIEDKIPTVQELDLPPMLNEIAMTKRGLVLFVGATGCGKSTSIAAMVGYRNENSKGHIMTIEDPVEYVHPHHNCIVTQREVGADTESWDNALKNTLRQAPDVILIGEIRARETMEYAIQFAETGHLVLATLHANNANQAMDRIINFFPEEKRDQVLMDVSLNLKAVISQRLVPREDKEGGRIAACEVMLNTPLIADLIFKGEVKQIKEVMSRSTEQGMKTFDQALFELFEQGYISYVDALRNADSQNELRLKIKLESKRAPQNLDEDEVVKSLSMKDEEEGQALR